MRPDGFEIPHQRNELEQQTFAMNRLELANNLVAIIRERASAHHRHSQAALARYGV